MPRALQGSGNIVRQRRPARQRDTEPVLGADVAQLVEQLTRNEQVVRSNRIVGSIFFLGFRGLTRAARFWRFALCGIWCRLVPSSLGWPALARLRTPLSQSSRSSEGL